MEASHNCLGCEEDHSGTRCSQFCLLRVLMTSIDHPTLGTLLKQPDMHLTLQASSLGNA